MAWIGDVVPYQQRQPVLARFLIGHILGLSTGAFVGGLAADELSWRFPFFCIAVLYSAIGIALLALNKRLPASARLIHKSEGPAIPRMVSDYKAVLARPWARLVLVTVAIEGACLYGAFAFIATHLHHTFGMSLTMAGALVMLYGFGGLLFALASHAFVKHFGEKGLTLWGGLFVAASLLAIGVAGAWWWAVPACLLAGLGFYMLHNTLQTNATQMAPERRGAALSTFAFCYFMGQSSGVAIAGLLVGQVGTGAIIIAGAAGVLGVALNFSRCLRLKARA
jgi:predicted MFS family arabinose efflux permease